MRTQIWNNGGGTQSAAIATLIVTGKLPKPDLAVIADTGREKSATWDYLDRYIAPALESVGVTMRRVKKEDYATKDLYGGADGQTLLIPAFTTQGGGRWQVERLLLGRMEARRGSPLGQHRARREGRHKLDWLFDRRDGPRPQSEALHEGARQVAC